MNYLKLFVALLTSASLVSAATNPRADANGVCYFDDEDGRRLAQIVRQGDDPAPLAEMLEGCQGLGFTPYLDKGLEGMIQIPRNAISRYLLPMIQFRGPRDFVPYSILRLALGCGNFEIAELMIAQGALNLRRAGLALWTPLGEDASLKDLQEFIARHRQQATALSPNCGDMREVRTEAEVGILVALAKQCQVIAGDRDTFDPTELLRAVLDGNYRLAEDEMARVALLLFHEGAELSGETRMLFAERYSEAYQMFIEWTREQIKDPGHE
jgi:hypothetical protein